MKLNIKQPCRIILTGVCPMFVVKHNTGQIYHIRPNQNGKIKVNIPAPGVYYINCELNNFEPLKKYDKINLPLPERGLIRPKEIRIKFEKCDSLARIYKEDKTIIVNQKFVNLPTQQQEFILLHELAHYDYADEEKTDLKALNDFLQAGFNPSQAFYALNNCLSNTQRNEKRVNKILKEIINNE